MHALPTDTVASPSTSATAGARSRTAATRSTTWQRMRPPHPGVRGSARSTRRPFAGPVRGCGWRARAGSSGRSASCPPRPTASPPRCRPAIGCSRRWPGVIAPLAGSLMNTLFGKEFVPILRGRPTARRGAEDISTLSLRGARCSRYGVLGRDAVIDELPRSRSQRLSSSASTIQRRRSSRRAIRAGVRGSRRSPSQPGTRRRPSADLVTAAIEEHLGRDDGDAPLQWWGWGTRTTASTRPHTTASGVAHVRSAIRRR